MNHEISPIYQTIQNIDTGPIPPGAGEETTKTKFPVLALLFISSGLALIGWVGYTYLQKQKSENNENELPPIL